MYPRLNRLSFYEDDAAEKKLQKNDCKFVGYPKLNVLLPDLREIVLRNVNFFDDLQYKLIDKFLQEEQEYINRLTVLEIQKYDLKAVNIPYYDLQNIFGLIEEIKALHECVFPRDLIQVSRVEDILTVFVIHGQKLRMYVMDQWIKSQLKFSGKQAVFKRFYNRDIVNSLTLPEQRISEYLKLHEHLKSNYEYLKSSDVFQQSFKLFNNIYIQMQYAKQTAVIDKFPAPSYQDILLVNTFTVTIDNGQPLSYKVFCMDDTLILTSQGNQTNVSKVEHTIRNNTISMNASAKDDLCFEIYEHLDKQQKRTYQFVSENIYNRTQWIETLKSMLYEQMLVVKKRVQSTSEESTSSLK